MTLPNMELLAREEAVRTRSDLAAFVHALRADLRASEDDWENPTLDRYLEALAAWIHDMPGYFKNQHIEEPVSRHGAWWPRSFTLRRPTSEQRSGLWPDRECSRTPPTVASQRPLAKVPLAAGAAR